MSLIKLGVAPGAEDVQAPTAARMIDRANRERWSGQGSAPGVDPAALSRRYGGDAAYAPRLQQATFKVPLGVSASSYEAERTRKIHLWINRMAKQGWDWCSDRRIQVLPGHYPAYDTDDRGRVVPDLGAREFVVRAHFRQRSPEFIRTEIRPELLRPLHLRSA